MNYSILPFPLTHTHTHSHTHSPPPPSSSLKGLDCYGETFCPVIHLRLSQPLSSREASEQLLEKIAEECMENDVAVVTAKYLKEEIHLPPPRSVWEWEHRNMGMGA